MRLLWEFIFRRKSFEGLSVVCLFRPPTINAILSSLRSRCLCRRSRRSDSSFPLYVGFRSILRVRCSSCNSALQASASPFSSAASWYARPWAAEIISSFTCSYCSTTDGRAMLVLTESSAAARIRRQNFSSSSIQFLILKGGGPRAHGAPALSSKFSPITR